MSLKQKGNNTDKKVESVKIVKGFKSFSHMLELLPTEDACREFLELVRWDNIPICPHCGSQSKDHYKLNYKGIFKGLRKCRDCKQRFTVTVNTMFEGSHIPLRKWFIAIYIFSAHKKGVSSHQLSRDLGLTQKSAWFLIGRLRNIYEDKTKVKVGFKKDVVSQCDETFIGGKNKNRHKDKKVENAQGRSVKDKTPVFGILTNGNVRTIVVPNTQENTLKPLIENMIEKGSIVVTDDWTAYTNLKDDYNHKVISHTEKVYMKDGFHTNSIEGFWSLLKRGIFGIYHSVSPKHLNEYCDEFAFRYNTRKLSDGDRFTLSLVKASKKISYKELTGKK